MRIEMTLRASMQLENIDGELKRWVMGCIDVLAAGKELPAEPMRTMPNTFFAKFNDYRLIFKREGDVIQVQDILLLYKELC